DVFAKERLAVVFADSNPRKAELVNLLQCPCCFQKTLRPDLSVECFFCGYRASGDDAADFFIAQNPGTHSRKYYCPECDNKTLIDLGVTGGAARGFRRPRPIPDSVLAQLDAHLHLLHPYAQAFDN